VSDVEEEASGSDADDSGQAGTDSAAASDPAVLEDEAPQPPLSESVEEVVELSTTPLSSLSPIAARAETAAMTAAAAASERPPAPRTALFRNVASAIMLFSRPLMAQAAAEPLAAFEAPPPEVAPAPATPSFAFTPSAAPAPPEERHADSLLPSSSSSSSSSSATPEEHHADTAEAADSLLPSSPSSSSSSSSAAPEDQHADSLASSSSSPLEEHHRPRMAEPAADPGRSSSCLMAQDAKQPAATPEEKKPEDDARLKQENELLAQRVRDLERQLESLRSAPQPEPPRERISAPSHGDGGSIRQPLLGGQAEEEQHERTGCQCAIL
jgi:hypothetical protein